ncbi:hypothetical protein F4779DRAFT_618959 [Xylariaceae sp. FL0662B]|nr:hypothetical protein F4779DRAFT_618959 [Xylariaceae sp. FL0662B]
MPTRVVVERSTPRSRPHASKGFVRSTYDAFTSSENASVVRSVVAFGAAVAFLASPWGESFLLPP